MEITVAPTVAEDVPQVIAKLPFRIKAMTAKRGDEVVAIGGLAFMPGGAVGAFLQVRDGFEVSRYPVTLHRVARKILEDARQMGLRRIVAISDNNITSAIPWLERLGFRHFAAEGGHEVFLWDH